MNKETKRKAKKNNLTIIASLCLILGILVGVVIGIIVFKTDAKVDKSNKPAELENGDKNSADNSEYFAIETPYCTLYYPNQWEDKIEIEQIEDEIYIVRFYATLEGKGKQQLFDIVFNGENQDIGYFDTKDGKINVGVVNVDVSFDDTWTEGEKNRIFAMQEEANYVLEMLKEQEGFVEY